MLSIHTASQALTSFWQQKRNRIAVISIGAICAVLVLSFSAFAAMQQKSIPEALVEAGDDVSEDEVKTTRPVLISGSSSVLLLGSVLSHETANIYPRRDGIVEDVYVDIGDTVQKNQVVALLLPKGVEGQSAALIAEKQARKSQAESDVKTASQVAEETLINTRQQINEKQTELMIAKREQEAMLQMFAESEANITQMREQALTAAQNARQLIEWILLGSNTRSGIDIQNNDLQRNLGIQDSSNASRYEGAYSLNALHEAESDYRSASEAQKSSAIDRLLALALDALNATNTILQYTPSQPSGNGIDQLSFDQLTDRLSKVISAQDTIYKMKEKLEDTRNSFQSLVAAEPELFNAYKYGSTEGAKSNQVAMLEEKIRTAENSLYLTEANQEQIIQRQKSMLDIASAMLQSEYAQSGHRQIRSPFSGVVSKRFLNVGQIVMPSMPAFELTDVPTSLAKIAKAEVQFGLPESLASAVEIGDTITFFLQSDETTPYTAEVTRKSPQVDMQTHTVTVQAKIPDFVKLSHGTSVRIRITDEKKPVFQVPSSAVKRKNDTNVIWILSPETEEPVEQAITVIAEDGEFAEITGSITEESNIILYSPALLND